jgi:ClpP class serine protease
MVFAARGVKPVIAYVSHLGASAAYRLAAAADEIVVSPESILGSIGTVLTLRKNDPKSNVIEIVSTQSPKKRLDPESAEGRAEAQSVADAISQTFIESVARYRGVSADVVLAEFGGGGVFVGQAAVDAGLADRMGSYESVLAELRDRTSAPRHGVVPAPRQPGARASSSTSERLMANGSQAEPGATPPAAPAAPAPTPTPAAPAAPAPAAPAPAPTAAAPVTDLSAVRAEAAKAERDRIAAIGALKKPGNEALIQTCIDDSTCTVDMAKARLYDHERATAAGQLNGLRGDEARTAAPKTTAAPNAADASTPRAAGRAAAEMHRSLTSSARSK